MVVRQGPVRFEIVCTGNICRSPYVHVVLQSALDALAPGDFTVTSSGTHALAGTPPEPGTRRAVIERGLSISGYRASQTTPQALSAADVVLVMDKDQRQHVIDEAPSVAKRTFLLKELTRLIRELDSEQPWEQRLRSLSDRSPRGRWAAVVRVLTRERERLRGDNDILADPFRLGHQAFVLMANEAGQAVDEIVAFEARLRSVR